MELTVKKLSLLNEKKLILDRISFSLRKGLYCLAGPNGSGKTSLLAILAGISDRTLGDIMVAQELQGTLGEDYRNKLGFLPQAFGLIPTMTPVRFLKYIAGLKGIPAYQAKQQINDLLMELGLSDKKNRKIAKLSMGEHQRIGIAQALLNNPELILLDEPFNHLDPEQRIALRRLLKQLSQKRTILYSTHLVSEIGEADEILLLKSGELIAKESLADLTTKFDGMIWEITEAVEAQLMKGKILSRVLQASQKKLRVYSEQQPHLTAVQVKPTVEDIYFYYMNPG
ncbi:ABC transporter ATP-binding protein [Enterococcus sp. LJL51]|uniref:ABC transporter ATP-binding protein n=1 Tax=Enterococcus sp. LJL51 TaxID=3416656 RepID=UPI003CEFE29D